MNPAQIHLAVNHAPLFCALIAAGLIIGALVRRNRSFVYAAIWLSVVGAILAIVAQQSGEAAEHILEGIEGINSSLIEAHEEAAKTAMLSSIVTAGIGLGIVFGRRWWGEHRIWGVTVLFLGALIATVVFMGTAAHKGGLIRHSAELENRLPVSPPTSEE